MKIAMIIIVVLQLLSFIAMAVSMAFGKSRLIDFFYFVCMALGTVALVLSFTGMSLNH